MENNNQDLLCCVRDMFGGCAGTPSSPNLRYMFAAVLAKQDDGCFALKVDIPIPSAIDVDSLLCGGATETVSVKDEALTQVYLAGQSDAIPVCVVNDKDVASAQKCDVNTGNTILIRSVFDDDTNTWENPTYFDLITGTAWAGNPATDLTECDSNTLESDKIVLCDDNGEFYRWIVKDNGEPTGVSYDTTISGVLYTPVGAVVECSDPTITLLPVCDVLTATVGGTIPYTLTGSNVAITYTPSLTLTNDTVLFYWTDFGTGYSDVGPSPDYTYEADGHYEIKSYAVTASGNKILIAAKEINVVAGVVTVNGTNPQVVNRSYSISVGSAMQEYSGTTPVGTPINPDGSAYTVQGTLAWSCPVVIDELEDNAEWNPENVADLVECVVGSANLVTEGLDGNITAAASVAGGSPNAIVHTLLGNTLAINGAGTNGASSAGLNVNISGGTFSAAQFTFNINVIGDEDPLDSADMGITVWDNVAGISVTATTITSSLSYLTDAQGVGLNMPIYAYPSTGSHTIVWTGDLPAGDYTVVLLTQDLGVLDMIELSVDHNIVSGPTTTTKAQLVALDQCTIDALTPEPVVTPVVGLTKTVQRTSGTYTVATNYKSVSVTAFSSDVTIDGAPVPMGFPWGVDSSSNERYTDTVTVTGTDYLITEVR